MPARILIAGLLVLLAAIPAAACPFCSAQGQTLLGEVNQADFIVLGKLANPKRDPDDFTRGTTDLVIDSVVKPNPYLAGKSTLVLPRFVPVDPKGSTDKFLVFCALYHKPADLAVAGVASSALFADPTRSQLDPYRGEPIKADSKLAEYLKGGLEVRGKDIQTRLRFFFDYLDSPELLIAGDAMMEFGNADYKDVRPLASTLPAEKLLGWLKDPNTPASRFGLYGLLIGHCGKADDAKALRELIVSNKTYSSGLDGLLAGYVLLDPKAGWEYVAGLAADPKLDFPVRYAALKAMRFFWEYRPDVVTKDKVVAAMRDLVAQSDIADLPIEDLRKWGAWDQSSYVLSFAEKPAHKAIPIVRRSILRFAIQAPDSDKAAKEFVEAARKADPERVQFVEQMLKDEAPMKK